MPLDCRTALELPRERRGRARYRLDCVARFSICADQTALRPLVRPASAGRTAILAENWRVVSLGHAMRLQNRAGVATGATSSSCNANRRPETSMKPLTAKPTPFVLHTQIHITKKNTSSRTHWFWGLLTACGAPVDSRGAF